jgi:hypothetical protein
MGVTGHVPVHMLANEAVHAGYDGIEHINQVMLNFFADHDTDTRTTKRFSLVAERMADFDPSSKEAKAFLDLLKARHTVLTPTFSVFQDLFIGRQGEVTPAPFSRAATSTQAAFRSRTRRRTRGTARAGTRQSPW